MEKIQPGDRADARLKLVPPTGKYDTKPRIPHLTLDRYDEPFFGELSRLLQNGKQVLVYKLASCVAMDAFFVLRKSYRLFSGLRLGIAREGFDFGSAKSDFLTLVKPYTQVEEPQHLQRIRDLLARIEPFQRPLENEHTHLLVPPTLKTLAPYDDVFFDQIYRDLAIASDPSSKEAIYKKIDEVIFVVFKVLEYLLGLSTYNLLKLKKQDGTFDYAFAYETFLSELPHYHLEQSKDPKLFQRAREVLEKIRVVYQQIVDERKKSKAKPTSTPLPDLKALFDELIKKPIHEKDLTRFRDKILGRGGFGVVYLGQWKGNRVAIKEFSNHFFTTDGSLNTKAKLENQKREMALLQHFRECQYIVQILGIVHKGQSIFDVVMECMRSLSGVYLKKQLTDYLKDRIVVGIVRGLKVLHSKGFVHRDLKGDNILLDSNFSARIADFGETAVKQLSDQVSERDTGEHGTRRWRAPETAQLKKFTASADIYSLGVLIWEMLARSKPYPEIPVTGPQIDVDHAIDAGNTPKISAKWPSPYPMVLRRCWSYNPMSRPSPDDLLEMFELEGGANDPSSRILKEGEDRIVLTVNCRGLKAGTDGSEQQKLLEEARLYFELDSEQEEIEESDVDGQLPRSSAPSLEPRRKPNLSPAPHEVHFLGSLELDENQFVPFMHRELDTLIFDEAKIVKKTMKDGRISFTVNCEALDQNEHQKLLNKALFFLRKQGQHPYEIAFSGCLALTVQKLVPFLQPGLSMLTITSCKKIENESVETLIATCPFIATSPLIIYFETTNRLYVNCEPIQEASEGRGSPLLALFRKEKSLHQRVFERAKLLSTGRQFQEMILNHCPELTMQTVTSFLNTQLEVLRVFNCQEIPSNLFDLVHSSCPLLRKLFINNCKGIRSEVSASRSSKITFPLMEIFEMKGCTEVTKVPLRSASMRSIRISGCGQLNIFALESDTLPLLDLDRIPSQLTIEKIREEKPTYKEKSSFTKVRQVRTPGGVVRFPRFSYLHGKKDSTDKDLPMEAAVKAEYAPALFYSGVSKLFERSPDETIPLFEKALNKGYLPAGCALKVLKNADVEGVKRINSSMEAQISKDAILDLKQALQDILLLAKDREAPSISCIAAEIYCLLGDFLKALKLFYNVQRHTSIYAEFARMRMDQVARLLNPFDVGSVRPLMGSEGFLMIPGLETGFLDDKLYDVLLESDIGKKETDMFSQIGGELAVRSFAHIAYGQMLRIRGDYSGALHYLDGAVEIDEKEVKKVNALAFAKRGELHFLLGHFQEATTDFAEAIEIANGQSIEFVRLYDRLLQMIQSQNHEENRLRILNPIWASEPRRFYASALRANFFLRNGNDKMAELDSYMAESSAKMESKKPFFASKKGDDAAYPFAREIYTKAVLKVKAKSSEVKVEPVEEKDKPPVAGVLPSDPGEKQ